MKKKKHNIKDVEQKIESNINEEIIDVEEKVQNSKFWYIIAICAAIIVGLAVFLVIQFLN